MTEIRKRSEMRKLGVLVKISIASIALGVILNPAAFADTVRSGGPCQNGDRDRIQEGYSFRCTKAPRSITNMNGKKLVWKQLPGRKLEWTTSTKSRIEVLNSLHFGIWKQADTSDISGFDGEAYISSWPCKIYMANSYEAQIWVWDRQVNANGYGGTWVPTDNEVWVVNEPNDGSAKCATYLSLHDGGKRITQ